MVLRPALPLAALAFLLAAGPEAWAQEEDPPPAEPAGAAESQATEVELLNRDNGWASGTIQEQLDRDTTLVPFGKGAIFVPAMTNPLDEPPVVIWWAGRKIAEGFTGTRVVIPPGTYEVRVGSGAVDQRIRQQVTVHENHTALIRPDWAGLSVHVVDEQFGSLRASYELIRVEDREYMGIGFGTDEQAGEPVTTWVLAPGLYKIVRLGESYRARRDFATVRLVAGQLTHFLLVVDSTSGEFAGGGEVPEEDLFRPQEGLFWSFVLGGDAALNSRTNVLGQPDGLAFALRAFLDSRASVEIGGSPLIIQFQMEEGQTKSPDIPWQKTNDRIDLDALYVYRWKPWLGPYLRLGAETNLLPGRAYFLDPTDYALLEANTQVIPDATGALFDQNGAPIAVVMGASEVELSPSLGLSTFKEGAGINVRVFKSLFTEATLRTGFGARHRITRDLYELTTSPPGAGGVRLFRRIDSVNQVGVETTILAVARISRWVVINVELDTLVPFGNFRNIILETESSVALKLTSYVSVNYVLRFLRDKQLSEADRLQQDVLLRFSVELF